MRRLAVCLFVFFVGCAKGPLDVRSSYVTHHSLASHHVRTPDPARLSPPVGQRLRCEWSYSKRQWKRFETPTLLLVMRFGNREEERLRIPLEDRRGVYVYDLLNRDYQRREGIRTYYAQVLSGDEVVGEWVHQVWTELVHVGEGN